MTGYVRQSSADIVPTAVVRAAPINNELNALRDAFEQTAGHKHDGTAAEGHYVPLIADADARNKVAVDTVNNRVGVFAEVGGAAVEQVRVQDGAIVPVTDNDIDLGTSSLEFKDLYIDGTANIDSLIADTADINAGTIDNTIIGATTAAAATVTSLTSTGTTTLNGTTIPASKTLVVTTDKLSALALTTSSELAGVISDETGSGALVFADTPTLVSPILGTPTSATLTNATGLPISTGVSGLATGVATFLATPSSTNLRAAITDETGTGSAVFATSPTLVTPILGTPTSVTLTNATGLPISTGVSGLGTGVATALAVNVGTAGSPVVNGGALGTPSSGTVTNLTGTASININGTVGATTANTGAFTNLSSTGNTTLGDASADTVTINGTVQPGVVISGSSTGSALRITQTGTGNALLVEDETNPDSTPFVIDAAGKVIVGNTTNTTNAGGFNLQLVGANSAAAGVSSAIFSNTNASGINRFVKSRSATLNTNSIVLADDFLGATEFCGADGTTYPVAASIAALVDGTPGTNDMPGRLVLSTTADGASTPTERVRITSTGRTGFATAAPAATVHVAGDAILSNVNVLGASYDSVFLSIAAEETFPTELFFSPDGLKMYVLGDVGNDVNEYNLSTAWVISSAVFVTNFSVSSQETNPAGLFFRADGTKMYIVGATNDTVYQYTLSTPWSVATASYDSISFSVASQEATPSGLWFKPNGLSMYMVGSSGDLVYQYTLSTAWNVSTATFLQSFSVAGQETSPNSVVFTGDGSRMFVLGDTGNDVNVYNLTTPWDISTAAFVNVFSVSGQDTAPLGLYIKPDGTKMYMVGAATDTVYQYTVPSIDIQLTGPTSAAALNVQQDLTVYGNTTGSFLNNGFRENIGGQYYNLVSQADIGTAPNEIPINQYLGDMAYMNSEAVVIQPQASVTPNGIGDMVFQLTSDTSLVVKVKGSDGTVRSATLTLA